MRKLALDIGELAVESFETAGAARGFGTVQARGAVPVVQDPRNDTTRLWSCQATCFTCTDCNTCVSCGGTCLDASCATCGGESCGPTMCQLTFADGCCA